MHIQKFVRKSLTISSLLLAVLATLPERGMAQLAGSGTINGTVSDATGAIVPAADITIRNTDTGIERKTQTTDAGDYTAAFLAPGHYEVQTSKQGFTSVLRKDLVLQVGQTLTINVGLIRTSGTTGSHGHRRRSRRGYREDGKFPGGEYFCRQQSAGCRTPLGHLRAADAERHD